MPDESSANAEPEIAAIVLEGPAAWVMAELARQVGVAPALALRQAIALYGWIIAARAQGHEVVIRQADGTLIEPLFHFHDEEDGERVSRGSL